MCEFASWIEMPPGKGDKPHILFLTTNLIPKALELGIDPLDLAGHEAIRRVYGKEKTEGVERECTNFTSPHNFPLEIVRAIIQGRMSGFGPVPMGLLSNALDGKYLAESKALNGRYCAENTALYDKQWAERTALYDKSLAESNALDDKYWVMVVDPANRAPAWQAVS